MHQLAIAVAGVIAVIISTSGYALTLQFKGTIKAFEERQHLIDFVFQK